MTDERPNSTDELEIESPTRESVQLVDHFFRHEYGQLVASLTRKFGVRNWELVEDVVQSALQRALASWSLRGIPPNPSAWLRRVASNLAIDSLRRDARWGTLSLQLSPLSSSRDSADGLEPTSVDPVFDDSCVEDDLLRMIFVCCDPAVPVESQVALSLKTLCGFSHREIARSLLSTEDNVAKRISRAKERLRSTGLEPSALRSRELAARLPDVQAVVYLLFNEGYSSTSVDKLIREELCEEAVRLACLLAEHVDTRGPSASAFLALLLFHAARLDSRIDDSGSMLLLKEQDRGLWDRDLIEVGFYWLQKSAVGETATRYHAEAWIAAEHCRAPSLEATDWERIAKGYDLLCTIAPSPVHELNRAIAIARRDGPEAGLTLFSQIESEKLEKDYYLWHAARAEFARLTGDISTARESLQRARELAPTRSEKEVISRKLDGLSE